MSTLEPLIADLAIILLVAGITTIICKKFKQPVILGYIIAGFITGHNFNFFPTVNSSSEINIWSEIGVIFLLFSLGLEFSFYKLKRVGGQAFIATFIIMFGTMSLGYIGGIFLGWNSMNSLFLGSMLAMSSTAIIIKNFEDLQLKGKTFAELVVGILIIEDIAGILIIALLSTLAATQAAPDLWQIMSIVLRLVFFIILWFVSGIYLVPTFFKKTQNIMNDETLLIVSIGFCLGMVVIVTNMGFSAALGAFMMGSFIAESPNITTITRLFQPVKDLFGAIFFVSVGMLVNPTLLLDYSSPVICILLITIFGKTLIAFLGSILAGQNLNTSIKCSLSLLPIGEFSFIIAGIGMSYGVIENFQYPIIVAISAITIFIAPYFILSATLIYTKLQKILPKRLLSWLNRYTEKGTDLESSSGDWQNLLKDYTLRSLILVTILTAIAFGSNTYLESYIKTHLPIPYGNFLTAIIGFCLMLPFLRALLLNRTAHPELFTVLWFKKRSNHLPLIILLLIKLSIAAFFIFYVFIELIETTTLNSILATGIAIYFISTSNWLMGKYLHIESRFLVNINDRHMEKYRKSLNIVDSKQSLMLFDEILHLTKFHVPANSPLIGKNLGELDVNNWFGCNIIQASDKKINCDLPAGDYVIKGNTDLLLIGTIEQFQLFSIAMEKGGNRLDQTLLPMPMRQFMASDTNNPPASAFFPCAITVDEHSGLINKSIRSANIRKKWHCLIIGIERSYSIDYNPNVNVVFEKNDLLWVLGKQKMINELVKAEIL